jgi:hypothetical protein
LLRHLSVLARRLLIPAIAAAMIIGGGAAIVPASAAVSVSASAGLATPNVIVGYYKTQRACNLAGAAGVRAGAWDHYVCTIIPPDTEWSLNVEYL